jgi:thiol-disulfide isomerase/thioredoxin
MKNKLPASEFIVGGVLLVSVALGGIIVFSGNDMRPAVPTTNTTTPYVEIVRPEVFVNTDSITLGELVGKKVILVDFMTYSCVNCQRTFPYLNQWYGAYKDHGLEIVGIHTPEFAFERDIDNVRRAAEKFGLAFPIVLDNNYATWSAYKNRYWPRKYLIDIHGNIVYDHIGEGAYDETEAKIVELLNERKQVLGEMGTVVVTGDDPQGVEVVDFSQVRTPETYLGAARIQYLVNLPNATCLQGSCTYSFSNIKDYQGYELMGAWRLTDEYAILESDTGALRLNFTARTVNLVAGAPEGKEVRAKIFIDGVQMESVTFTDEYDLYQIVDLPEYGSHILEIQFEDPGIATFAFTFG